MFWLPLIFGWLQCSCLQPQLLSALVHLFLCFIPAAPGSELVTDILGQRCDKPGYRSATPTFAMSSREAWKYKKHKWSILQQSLAEISVPQKEQRGSTGYPRRHTRQHAPVTDWLKKSKSMKLKGKVLLINSAKSPLCLCTLSFFVSR